MTAPFASIAERSTAAVGREAGCDVPIVRATLLLHAASMEQLRARITYRSESFTVAGARRQRCIEKRHPKTPRTSESRHRPRMKDSRRVDGDNTIGR